MSLVIWGAGAIGGTIGAYLARAGHEVLFVDRDPEHVAAMNERGLRITGPVDEFSVRVNALQPEDLSGEFETVMLATKTQHTAEASEHIKVHLSPDGCVVSAQNGLNVLQIQQVVGKQRSVGALINFGADVQGPGEIFFGGRGAVVLGETDGATSARVDALHELMLDFDNQATTTDDILGYLWGKTIFAGIVFITALTNEPVADSLANQNFRDVYVEGAGELASLAQKLGASPRSFMGFDPEAFVPGTERRKVDAALMALIEMSRSSGKTHSGIWRDLAVRKRKTEVEMFDGLLSEGERLGLPMNFTRNWKNMIHEVEDDKRPLGVANLTELKASLG